MPNTKAVAAGVESRLQMLAFLRRYITEFGQAPSVREIAEGMAYASPNAVPGHLRRLEEDGFITTRPGIARSIQLTAKGKRATA